MEQLRLVGRTAGNDGLVFAAGEHAGSPSFVMPFGAAHRPPTFRVGAARAAVAARNGRADAATPAG